jgi:hypothetical protein
MFTKMSSKKRLQALLAGLMILTVLEPFSPTSPIHADSFAAVFAYDPTTISQEVTVSDIANTTQFTMTASVAKAWANDDVYIEALFKDSSGTVLASKRNPTSGSTTLTSDSPVEMSVSLPSSDPDWSASIAKVEVIVWGDDGEYWAGNYGIVVDWVKLEQTTSSGTSQLLLNPEFANGDTNWTSSMGWQACNGGGGASVCITNIYAPSTSSPTTSVAPPTSSTSSTTSTTTTTVAASSSTTTVAPSSTTTAAPVGQAAIPRVSTTVAGASTTSTSTTTVAPTSTSTTSIPPSPNVAPGEVSLIIGGEKVSTSLTRKDNQLLISSGAMNAVISGRHADGSMAALDSDGNIRLKAGDQLLVDASGFEPESDLEVWIFSTPVRLGTAAVKTTGSASAAFTVPPGVESGKHGVVLTGVNPLDERAVFSVGIMIGSEGGVSTIGKILIGLPISLAILVALAIPARRRRRRAVSPA